MKQSNFGIFLGAGLILLGVLFLIEKIGLLHGVADLFWGLIFVAGAAFFLRIYTKDSGTQWWAIIPGMVLLGIGLSALLPGPVKFLDSLLFLGSIGVAFWIIYITDRTRWWAIIPAGVLSTLAVVSVLDHISGLATGGLFFLGLGLTFLLVARLPGGDANNQWAYIPGGILLTIGLFISMSAKLAMIRYIGPIVLILIGGLLIFFYFKKRN